ncbi:putative nucleotidyl transferase [uncultured delta proteobacterium]|uniref:Putative nucleotidyl transferase n=1 Tax=uncultured delta proteobacterium TaxID=34034 RepID=A0A212KH07_9DELT|nr:putative nucleotidyl transferase [uncultured delta proteobacterium]
MLTVAILAGGLATRMRPATETIPKSLLDVAGEPFVYHQLRLLQRRGITRVVFCLGYLGGQIESAVGDGSQFGLSVSYSYDGPELLGTGGALRRALPLFGESFFVLYGDSYLPCDFATVQAAFRESGKPALMTVFRNEGRFDASNVIFENGIIVRYDKKEKNPRMQHIDYGLGILTANDLEYCIPAGTKYDLADLYRVLLERGHLAGYEVFERFYEIGSPQGLRELAERIGFLP